MIGLLKNFERGEKMVRKRGCSVLNNFENSLIQDQKLNEKRSLQIVLLTFKNPQAVQLLQHPPSIFSLNFSQIKLFKLYTPDYHGNTTHFT